MRKRQRHEDSDPIAIDDEEFQPLRKNGGCSVDIGFRRTARIDLEG